MKKPHLLLGIAIIFCIFSFRLYGQDTLKHDSLVFFDELTFHSDFERESFERFILSAKKDYAAMFFAINEDVKSEDFEKVQRSIQSEIVKYDSPSYKKMKEAKRMKKILKEIHDDYFKKYEELTYFDKIFSIGVFNCVSASALYAIVFEGLDIPYSIKISLNHVYLIAYPSTNSIMVETTNPMEGYYVYNQHFKGNYVDYLKTIKLISEEEYKNKTTEELFEEYFYRETDIDIQELIGIQYSNKGLAFLNEEKFEEAFQAFEKTYFLFPSERNGYYLLLSNALTLNDCDYLDIKYADYLSKLCRYKDMGVSNENIEAEFGDITYKVLINNSNPTLYDEYYEKLNNSISDSAFKADIGYIYNYERGRFLFNKLNYKESLPYTEEAYKIKPKNADAQNLFITNLILTYSEMDDPNYILNKLYDYSQKYPDLKENNKFAIFQFSNILTLCEQSFAMRNSEKAFEYLAMFENSVQVDNDELDIHLIKNSIVNAYSSAASYYFRRNDYSHAKSYLQKGLEYVPGNYELTNKLNALR